MATVLLLSNQEKASSSVVALCVAFDENSNDNGEPATAGSSSDARSSKVNFSLGTINMWAL